MNLIFKCVLVEIDYNKTRFKKNCKIQRIAMNHQLMTLKNNLKTLLVHSDGATSGTVQIWFRAGSALEEDSNRGISHFLEHMFFKGTPTRPGSKIAHEVESFGGEINAFTSFDYTSYYINAPSMNLLSATEILMDMVSHPSFLESELIPERDVVFEEFRRGMDSPSQTSFHQIQNHIFTGNYSHQILGNEQTIKNFSRDQLIEYRKKFYNSKNALLVIAGNITEEFKEEIISTIEKFSIPEGEQSFFPKFQLQSAPQIHFHEKDVKTATLTLAIQASPYLSKDSPIEDLTMSVLGHGETSILYKELVLKNSLANYAQASTMLLNDGGCHFIRVTFPLENITGVLTSLTQTLEFVKTQGFQEHDIQKIKNQYIASKIYEKESIESMAYSLGQSYAQTENINAENDFIQAIKEGSATSVNSMLNKILNSVIHVSLQVPNITNKTLSKSKLESILKNFSQDLNSKNTKKKKSSDSKNQLKNNFTTETLEQDPAVKLITIKQGIKLIYRYNKIAPTFIMQAYLRGGLGEESASNNGVYQLMANMLGKGYTQEKSVIDFHHLKTYLEEKSASLHGFSGKNAYGLMLHGLSENFSTLARHFFHSFLYPTFDAKFINHEKKIFQRSLDQQGTDPTKICFKKVQELTFGNHPYAMNPLGSTKSLKKIQSSTLKNLHAKNLSTKEIVFVYCGDMSLEDVQSELQFYFHQIKPRKEKALQIKKIKSAKNFNASITMDREQTQIMYFIPLEKSSHPEHLYIKMLNTHLSGQSSELFVDVRDRKGLCYSASPVHMNGMWGGYFGIYMASGFDKVEPGVKALKELISKIQKHGLSLEEFTRIKKMIQGQNMINIQTNEDYASIYSVPVLQKMGLNYWHENNLAMDKMSHSDFQKNIKKILNKDWRLVLVGKNLKT